MRFWLGAMLALGLAVCPLSGRVTRAIAQVNPEPEPTESEPAARTADPENRFLPPEIREDVELPPSAAPEPSPEADDAEPAPEAPPAKPKSSKKKPQKKEERGSKKRATKTRKNPERVVDPERDRPFVVTPLPGGSVANPPPDEEDESADSQEIRRRIAAEAAADVREAERLNRQAEREAKRRGKGSRRRNESIGKTPAGAPSPAASPAPAQETMPTAVARLRSWLTGSPAQPVASAAPIPAPSPSPSAASSGRSKRRKKSKSGTEAPASPGSPASPNLSPPDPMAGKGERRHRRGSDKYARTGEEAPIKVSGSDFDGVKPVVQSAPVLEPLRQVLLTLADKPRVPLEQDLAVAYLGYLGDTSHLSLLQKRLDDPKLDDSQKLPLLAILVDAFGEAAHRPALFRIVDAPATPTFLKLWALEILSRLGDSTRVAALYKVVDDPKADQSDQLRGLSILADLGDASRKATASKLSNDGSLFLATRLQALAIMSRMQPGAANAELKKHMNAQKLSVEERLSIALDLCQLGEDSAADFLRRVVESEADTVFDQLRALHGLALLGRPCFLGPLFQLIQTRKRPKVVASRIAVMMGDRSRVADLLSDARTGDLEAIRTLVLAHVMDSQKLSAKDLYHKPRYRSLVAP